MLTKKSWLTEYEIKSLSVCNHLVLDGSLEFIILLVT